MKRLLLAGLLLSVLHTWTHGFWNENPKKSYKDADEVRKCPMARPSAGESWVQILHVTDKDVYFRESDDVEILTRINIRHGKAIYLLDAVTEEQSTESIVLEKLKIFNCSEACAGDYMLEVKNGKDVMQCYSWHVMLLENEPKVEISIDSQNLIVDENYVLWNESVIVKCTVEGGRIEDLKVQERRKGQASWSDVNPSNVKISKKTDYSTIEYIFPARSPISLRCLNKTDEKDWTVDVNLTGITDPTIEERNVDGSIILDCLMPMSYTGSIYWQKDDEAIGPERPQVEDYVKIYSVNTSIFHPPWGEFACLNDDEELTHEVCRECS